MASAAIMAEPRAWPVRRLFVATILTGSFLLFLTQPMIARMALPRLGGAPAVWNSAMLVYQALLLGGYAYAHLLGRLAPRGQAFVHLALLALAALWLPIGLAAANPPVDADPALWVPWLLLVSIGPLFLAVSAQAPLMQRWFALVAPGANPYALYAASNLGSFAGLIAYPALVEPRLRIVDQSWLWSVGYGLLVLFVLICAVVVGRAHPTRVQTPHAVTAPPSWRRWVEWIALAVVPSGLMLSTTTHLTTDIVAMPLIWVIPLGLYLLSFSVAFSDRGRLASMIGYGMPILAVIAAARVFAGSGNPIVSAALDLGLLFAVAVTLHREMYRRRPAPDHLTAFYLAMSIGGVLGGAFCALLAPLLFDWVYEHPLLIAAAVLLARPRPLLPLLARLWSDPARAARLTRMFAAAAFILSLVAAGLLLESLPAWAPTAAAFLIILLAFLAIGRPLLLAWCVVALMLGKGGIDNLRLSFASDVRVRSYFGVYTVVDRPEGVRTLVHGTTLHGVQKLAPGRAADPTSYYAPYSGVGLALRAAPDLYGPAARIGVVGLGAGTLACYARPGQHWRLYEIDPAVVRIARDSGRFTFLSRCLPHPQMLIGDARLTLATQAHAPHDVLVVDAFSSDAVPMHLLTREAFGVYRATLADRGMLLIHISNRYLDLKPVLAAAAAQGGWTAVIRDFVPGDAEARAGDSRSIWVAMARDPAVLQRLSAGGFIWAPLAARPGFAGWTDDYGSILPLLRRPR